MSVLVKDMKMPKNCHSCPMCLMRFCQAGDRELSEQETRPNAKRPEDCSLVPVPPHDDLIDYDFCMQNYELLHDDDGNPVYAVRMREINSAPTVIPASEEGET